LADALRGVFGFGAWRNSRPCFRVLGDVAAVAKRLKVGDAARAQIRPIDDVVNFKFGFASAPLATWRNLEFGPAQKSPVLRLHVLLVFHGAWRCASESDRIKSALRAERGFLAFWARASRADGFGGWLLPLRSFASSLLPARVKTSSNTDAGLCANYHPAGPIY